MNGQMVEWLNMCSIFRSSEISSDSHPIKKCKLTYYILISNTIIVVAIDTISPVGVKIHGDETDSKLS